MPLPFIMFILQQMVDWVTHPAVTGMLPDMKDRIKTINEYVFYGILGEPKESKK